MDRHLPLMFAVGLFALANPAQAQFVCGPTGTYSLLALDITINVAGSSAGSGALACGNNTVASGNAAVAVGDSASATGTSAIALGSGSTASGTSSVAVGIGASVTGNSAVAIGQGSTAGFSNSVAIGAGVSASAANQVAIGGATNTYRLAGITSAASIAAQVGPVSVLTSDGNGNLAAVDINTLLSSSPVDTAAINSRLNNHEARISNVERGVGEAKRGVAAAMSLAGGATLPAGKQTAVSANWGTFGGEHAFGASATVAVSNGVYLGGGLAVTSNEIGGRAGLTYAW